MISYDFTRLKIDLETEFHLLRHLSKLNPQILKQLIDAGYSMSHIQSELTVPGSRFSAAFAGSTSELIKRLKDQNYGSYMGENGNLILSYKFNSWEFPDGIGSVSVIPASEVRPAQIDNLVKRSNRGFLVWHLPIKELPLTHSCALIIRPGKDFDTLITAFPGDPGMPIPFEGMEPKLYKKCADYWANHVFLVES